MSGLRLVPGEVAEYPRRRRHPVVAFLGSAVFWVPVAIFALVWVGAH